VTLAQIKQALLKHEIDQIILGGFDFEGVLRGKYIELSRRLWTEVDTTALCE
jgi:hypothetical protein